MKTFVDQELRGSEDDDSTYVLSPEQRQQFYRRRSALLSGLITPEQSANVSSGLAEVIDHRERIHARQTQALDKLVQEVLAQEQAPQRQAPLPKDAIRIQPPGTPRTRGPESAQPQPPVAPQARGPEPASQAQAQPPKPASHRRVLSGLRRRIPVLLQLTEVECGAACLAMILNYYGRRTTIADVRQRCQVGRDGLSALDVVHAARSYGLRVRAVSLQEDDLSLITCPATIHWEFNHFMIVERVSATWVEVVDPALGRRRLTMKEFFDGFTGIVLMLEPGVQFERETFARRVSLASYARTYLKLAPMSTMQILGASLLLQVFGLAVPLLTAVVVNQVIPLQLRDTLLLLAVGLLVLVVAQVVMSLLRSVVLLSLQTRVDTRMMLGFFEHLTSLPLRFFQQRSSGDLLARLSSNIVIRDTVSNQLVSTLLDGSLVVTYLLLLLKSSLFFGVVALAIGGIQVAILLSSTRLIRPLAKQELLAQGKFHGYAAEALMGITTLKAAGAEQRALEHWTNLFFEQMNASVRRHYLASLVDLAVANLRALAPLLLLVIGTMQVLQGTLQAGTMLALVTLATSFLVPLSALVESGQRLQVVRARQKIPASRNRPRLGGQPVDALAYRERILVGFERMYRLLMRHRDALRSEVLPRFAQDEMRFIARPTDLYARFLYDSFRPELLRDAHARERHFDRLRVGIQWQPALARLIPAEQADLQSGDIPLFTTRPASRDLFTSQGAAIPAFFQASSLDLVRQRLCQLDEDDLTRQRAIIHAAFESLERDTPARARLVASAQGHAARVFPARLVEGACALGDALERSAIRGAGRAGWLGLTQVREREWTLQPAGWDVYDGLPGIMLFLAHLGALTGEQRYQRLAEAALHNMRMLLKHPHKQEAMTSIGAFEGWGGLIYLFAHLGSLWKESALFQEAADLTQLLPEMIEQDDSLDIMAGAAGCISALLSLYTVAPASDTLELAGRCGDHLLARAHPMPQGIGWKVPQQATPLTGFAHGNAGIAFSLLRLADVSGADRFHQAALAALAYERSLFSPARRNWPDLRTFGARDQISQAREEEAQQFAIAWCHGASGIGLARLASLPFVDDAAIRQEIEAAIQTTQAHDLEADYSLCHGLAGHLETLLMASQVLGSAPYQEALEQRTKMLLCRAHDLTTPTTDVSIKEPPGLMLGLAGIGYTLLRVAAPERVPSILALAPPPS